MLAQLVADLEGVAQAATTGTVAAAPKALAAQAANTAKL
jgi:hypothetical protein